MREKRGIFFALMLFAGFLKAEPFDVAVPGPGEDDTLLLQGDYVPPTDESAPVLVFLHGLGSSRGEWDPLVERARRRGWGTLAYDLRGHGRSRGTLSGETVDHEVKHYGRDPAFWQLMPDDLEQVLSALIEKTNISRSRVTLIGASLGANVCLTVAARGGDRAVLLSPGLDYAGIETETPISALKAPALVIVAKPDAYAFLSAERLATLAPKGLLTYLPLPGGTTRGNHGVQMFDGKLEEIILDWVVSGKIPSPSKSKGPKR